MADTQESNKKNWFARHKVWTVVLVLVVLGVVINANSSSSTVKTSSTAASTPASKAKSSTQPAAKLTAPVAARQITGKPTTLGAGTFAGGKDVAVGLYDVTPGGGQSGNFMVSGTDSYNEVLGGSADLGVSKVRAKISNGDSIQISGLSQVAFTPVTTPFVTTHTAVNLYAGTFIVGQDIGAGRYVASPGAGQSGNFMVNGSNSYNEILGGDSSSGGVPSLTINLTKNDTITISGLSQVAVAPSN